MHSRVPPAQTFIDRYHVVELICCALLLTLFCARIWDLGLTNTDDGLWALWTHQADKHPAASFARDQGRFWGFGGGAWITLGLHFFGTGFGNLLIVGSFLLFFALFIWSVSVYWSSSIAFLAAGLFLALFAFRADRSILYAYPLFFWMPASAVCAAVLLARRFQNRGGWVSLGLGGLLFLVGLFNNEGAIVLSLIVVAAALLTNYRQAIGRAGIPEQPRRRFRAGVAIYGAIAAVFVAVSVIWRLNHPSPYSGNTLAPFDARKIGATLFGFITSGTILYDVVHPYVQTFYDTLLDRAVRVVYAPGRYLATAAANPVSLITGVLAACLLARTLSRDVTVASSTLALGIVAGLVLATVPLLPVAMTVQYQSWFYLYDAHAYSHTIFATFGLGLAASCLCSLLLKVVCSRPVVRGGVVCLIAAVLGGVAALGNQVNDAIARDFRPEGARWRVLGDVVKMAAASGASASTILMPRLRNGSWFAMMPPDYWSDYARDVLGTTVRFADHELTLQTIERGAGYADYQFERDGRHVAITLAHVVRPPAPAMSPIADRITVMIERPFDPQASDRILAFDDVHTGLQQIPLSTMRAIGKGLWTVDGLQAVPTSARILDASTTPRLLVQCRTLAPLGVTLLAARTMLAGSSCLADGYLNRGWAAPETTATWSIGRDALVELPIEGPPPPKLQMQIDASSYTGMGFYAGLQTVRVRVGNRLAATWEFRPGQGPLPPLDVSASDWRPAEGSKDRHILELAFEIDPPYQPKKLGFGTDERELGLLLRSITLRIPTN